MSKILKFFGIIIGIGVIGYLFFLFFMMPDQNNSAGLVTTSFLDNISSETVCDTHFNPETIALCESFQTAMKNETFEYELFASGDDIVASITIGSTTEEFTFSFITKPNTGISGFFNSTNFYIDLIE